MTDMEPLTTAELDEMVARRIAQRREDETQFARLIAEVRRVRQTSAPPGMTDTPPSLSPDDADLVARLRDEAWLTRFMDARLRETAGIERGDAARRIARSLLSQTGPQTT